MGLCSDPPQPFSPSRSTGRNQYPAAGAIPLQPGKRIGKTLGSDPRRGGSAGLVPQGWRGHLLLPVVSALSATTVPLAALGAQPGSEGPTGQPLAAGGRLQRGRVALLRGRLQPAAAAPRRAPGWAAPLRGRAPDWAPGADSPRLPGCTAAPALPSAASPGRDGAGTGADGAGTGRAEPSRKIRGAAGAPCPGPARPTT